MSKKKQKKNKAETFLINALFQIIDQLKGFRGFFELLYKAFEVAYSQTKKYLESKVFVYDGDKYHFVVSQYSDKSLKIEIKNPKKVLLLELTENDEKNPIYNDEILIRKNIQKNILDSLLQTGLFMHCGLKTKAGNMLWKIK